MFLRDIGEVLVLLTEGGFSRTLSFGGVTRGGAHALTDSGDVQHIPVHPHFHPRIALLNMLPADSELKGVGIVARTGYRWLAVTREEYENFIKEYQS